MAGNFHSFFNTCLYPVKPYNYLFCPHTHTIPYISSDMYMLSQPIPLKTPPVYTTHYPLSTVPNRTSTILSINPTLPHLHPPCIRTTSFSLSHTAYFYTWGLYSILTYYLIIYLFKSLHPTMVYIIQCNYWNVIHYMYTWY